MTQIEELVKRARANKGSLEMRASVALEIVDDLADALEAQAARIAELEKEFSESEDRYNKAIEEGAMKIMEAETERDEFRAKLERVEAERDSEREACAKIADAHLSKVQINEQLWHEGQDWAAQRIAEAIRGRTAAEVERRRTNEIPYFDA